MVKIIRQEVVNLIGIRGSVYFGLMGSISVGFSNDLSILWIYKNLDQIWHQIEKHLHKLMCKCLIFEGGGNLVRQEGIFYTSFNT